ncbi:MAG: NADH-quinone oxidoreductase, E subunit [uncultured bacterium]|nr:MAG: NADH-quinone oxidoreductase, E subunit [uncultured bacterium]
MKFVFDQPLQAEIQKMLDRTPHRQTALLPVLWLVQSQLGHVSLEAQEAVSDLLGLSAANVCGVTSFYTMFKTKPVGKYHLQLCRTLSCALGGSESLVRHLADQYRLENGGMTPDGLFSLELVECLASCGSGPAMMVNGSLMECLTIEKLDKILEKLM